MPLTDYAGLGMDCNRLPLSYFPTFRSRIPCQMEDEGILTAGTLEKVSGQQSSLSPVLFSVM